MWPFTNPEVRPLVQHIIDLIEEDFIWNITGSFNEKEGSIKLQHKDKNFSLEYESKYECGYGDGYWIKSIKFPEGFDFELTRYERKRLVKALDKLLKILYKKKQDRKYNQCYDALLEL